MSPPKLNLFFDMAIRIAKESKYVSTHVGCIIMKNNRDVSFGWNGYPSGSNDELLNSLSREDRLSLVIHAEENAILNATKKGVTLDGTTAFITHAPCVECLRRLHCSGVSNVFYIKNDDFEEKWIKPKSHLYKYIPLWNNTKGFYLNELELMLEDEYHTLGRKNGYICDK